MGVQMVCSSHFVLYTKCVYYRFNLYHILVLFSFSQFVLNFLQIYIHAARCSSGVIIFTRSESYGIFVTYRKLQFSPGRLQSCVTGEKPKREKRTMNDEEIDLHLSIPDDFDKKFRWTTGRREFCYHMARLGDTKKAAEAAGMSPTSGPYLFQLQPVRDVIETELRRMIRATGENEESVVARWSMWADSDVGDYFIGDYQLRPLDDLSKEQRQCIKKIKISHNARGDRNVDLELHDQHKANNDLAVMMGLLGKGDNDTTPPEETAHAIQRALQEMKSVNGLQQELDGSETNGERTIN